MAWMYYLAQAQIILFLEYSFPWKQGADDSNDSEKNNFWNCHCDRLWSDEKSRVRALHSLSWLVKAMASFGFRASSLK